MQLKLIANTWSKKKFAFGASLLKGSHPKTKRPFHSTLPLHVVMKSSRASGRQSLLAHNEAVASILDGQAAKHAVHVHAAANAGNHLHLLIEAPSRQHLAAFLRAVTGRIAELVDARKGFWDARPFSRIVSWGRDFKNVCRYLGLNTLELIGMNRASIRGMHAQINKALRDGTLTRSPGLIAAGFG